MENEALDKTLELTPEHYIVLDKFKRPSTIREIATELSFSYWKVYRLVEDLRNQYLITILPFKRGRSNIYHTLQEPGKNDHLMFAWKGESVRPVDLIQRLLNSKNSLEKTQDIGLIILHLAAKSFWSRSFGEDPFPPEASLDKAILYEIRAYFEGLNSIIDQIIASPIWGELEKVDELLGVNRKFIEDHKVVEIVQQWEKRVLETYKRS